MDLKLERRNQVNETAAVAVGENSTVLIAPFVDEDYWEYRVQVTDDNAVVGFPKFNTIGIGFAVEEDWNTNLPYRCTAERIASHIEVNRPKGLRRAKVIEAIKLIQAAAHEDRGTDPADVLG